MPSHHLARLTEEKEEGEQFEATIACAIALTMQKPAICR
jgi:hypothetical protein